MDDEGPSPNSGVARLIVLLCAFALATIGAFTAFFATEILAAVFHRPARPSTIVLILLALVPIVTAVAASVVTVRVHGMGKVLSLGCGTLVLGALVTVVLVFAVAI
jgi:hypothetical protein